MDEWRLACPDCGGVLCREMGCLYRCVACRRLFAVTGGYAEPMGTKFDLSGPDDWQAERALGRRGTL